MAEVSPYALNCVTNTDYDNITRVQEIIEPFYTHLGFKIVELDVTKITRFARGRCVWMLKISRADNEQITEEMFNHVSARVRHAVPMNGELQSVAFSISAIDTSIIIFFAVLGCECASVFLYNRAVDKTQLKFTHYYVNVTKLDEIDIERFGPLKLTVFTTDEDGDIIRSEIICVNEREEFDAVAAIESCNASDK